MTAKEIVEALSSMESRYWSFTPEDKALLLQIANDEGLIINTHCPDCYRDAFITLRNRHMKTNKKKQGKYEFIGNRTLWWRGQPINADTPLKVIEAFLASDKLNHNFFKKIVKEKTDENTEI